ncbi:hypothetical protein ACI1MP_37000 [Kitasatospora griseola]|uniref:hypothetical protein n=1 Tax=Kitasatospora griseola TaxID=2064 RepID=UPI003855E77C
MFPAQTGQGQSVRTHHVLTHLLVHRVCGPNVPGEPYFEATGRTETYEFAPDATAYVLNQTKPEQGLRHLVKIVQGCKGSAHTAPAPYFCYANQFTVQFDQQGRITSATQMYRA